MILQEIGFFSVFVSTTYQEHLSNLTSVEFIRTKKLNQVTPTLSSYNR